MGNKSSSFIFFHFDQLVWYVKHRALDLTSLHFSWFLQSSASVSDAEPTDLACFMIQILTFLYIAHSNINNSNRGKKYNYNDESRE